MVTVHCLFHDNDNADYFEEMKIGDRVRFLSETGGGRVAGFKGNLVMVEDEDGFQIPTPLSDVVLVGSTDEYDTINQVKTKVSRQESSDVREYSHEGDDADDMVQLNHTFKFPVEERKGGNVLNCYLAFVPTEANAATSTHFECYFVNDSNYYIRYNYLLVENANWTLHASGEVEPNTKSLIEEFSREQLNDYDRVAIQLIAYKRDKSFVLKPTVDVQFRIDKMKFFKIHTFVENEFFEQSALLYPIVENDKVARPLVIDSEQLKREMYKNNVANDVINDNVDIADTYVRRYDNGKKGNPFVNKRVADDILVVDLHAHSLLETTSGMTSADILNYQMDIFRRTLNENKGSKGKRIIFIHGKGEGVLRHAIVSELKYKYKNYRYQDASFQEYGYGATQVTIR